MVGPIEASQAGEWLRREIVAEFRRLRGESRMTGARTRQVYQIAVFLTLHRLGVNMPEIVRAAENQAG